VEAALRQTHNYVAEHKWVNHTRYLCPRTTTSCDEMLDVFGKQSCIILSLIGSFRGMTFGFMLYDGTKVGYVNDEGCHTEEGITQNFVIRSIVARHDSGVFTMYTRDDSAWWRVTEPREHIVNIFVELANVYPELLVYESYSSNHTEGYYNLNCVFVKRLGDCVRCGKTEQCCECSGKFYC